MKRNYLPIFAAAVLTGLTAGYAQDATPAPSASPAPAGPGKGMGDGRRMMRDRFLASLTPEVRARFEAARDKAMQDPKIKELQAAADKANMEMFKAVREKMLEIDPGLADLIKKRNEDGPHGPRDGMNRPGGSGPNNPGFANLTDAERDKLMAAREKAKSDLTVEAAEKKKDEATSPEDRKAASEAYRQAMREAILKVDPSLAPVLDKLNPPKPPEASTPAPNAQGGGAMPQDK